MTSCCTRSVAQSAVASDESVPSVCVTPASASTSLSAMARSSSSSDDCEISSPFTSTRDRAQGVASGSDERAGACERDERGDSFHDAAEPTGAASSSGISSRRSSTNAAGTLAPLAVTGTTTSPASLATAFGTSRRSRSFFDSGSVEAA